MSSLVERARKMCLTQLVVYSRRRINIVLNRKGINIEEEEEEEEE